MDAKHQTLMPLRSSQTPWRGLYGITHKGSNYVIEVDYFDIGEHILLYRDGNLIESKRSPARFQLADGSTIEASLSLYGMKVARLTLPYAASSIALDPLPGTAEARRAAFSDRHPSFSSGIAFTSWLVLTTALITQIPNIINGISFFTGFSVPSFGLPDALNIFLGVAGVAGGLDRGLRMKYHPLLDN